MPPKRKPRVRCRQTLRQALEGVGRRFAATSGQGTQGNIEPRHRNGTRSSTAIVPTTRRPRTCRTDRSYRRGSKKRAEVTEGVVVQAAGSLPRRPERPMARPEMPSSNHVEYGYPAWVRELPVRSLKMAAPDRRGHRHGRDGSSVPDDVAGRSSPQVAEGIRSS